VDRYQEIVQRLADKTYTPSDLAWLVHEIDRLREQVQKCS